MNKQILAVLAAASLFALAPASASAQSTTGSGTSAGPGYGRGYGMGPGMMGGYGGGPSPRAASNDRDDGPDDWEMGPGMMRGWGGWGGMGPGMMGGGYGRWGMGPGMMGAYGFGPGALASLDLTDAQVKQIDAIQDARDKKQWALMTAMHDTMLANRRTFDQQAPDVDAVMKTATTMSDIRLQMMRNQLETQKQIFGVLTAQQQQQLRQYGRRRW